MFLRPPSWALLSWALLSWALLSSAPFVCACEGSSNTDDTEPPDPRDAGGTGSHGDAAPAAAPCNASPPRLFDTGSQGELQVELGVPDSEAGLDFVLLGDGCEVPVFRTFQGLAFLRLGARVPQRQLTDGQKLSFALTVSDLSETPGSPIEHAIDQPLTPSCRDDGYCYVVPIMTDIAELSPVLDGLAAGLELQLRTDDSQGSSRAWGVLAVTDL